MAAKCPACQINQKGWCDEFCDALEISFKKNTKKYPVETLSEIIQMTAAKGLESIAWFKGECSFKTWIINTIFENQKKDYFTRHYRPLTHKLFKKFSNPPDGIKDVCRRYLDYMTYRESNKQLTFDDPPLSPEAKEELLSLSKQPSWKTMVENLSDTGAGSIKEYPAGTEHVCAQRGISISIKNAVLRVTKPPMPEAARDELLNLSDQDEWKKKINQLYEWSRDRVEKNTDGNTDRERLDHIISLLEQSVDKFLQQCARLFKDLLDIYRQDATQEDLAFRYSIRPDAMRGRLRECRKRIARLSLGGV